ncbi:MAG: NAD(P)-binding domain-containing protein [Planctomycetota bacterium]
MTWSLLVGLVLALGVALLAVLLRRGELRSMRKRLLERDRALRAGSAKAQLQHPVVDLSRCLGCGACVRACPENGVLELVHGQAAVVNGAHCKGHSACERECPTAAITVTLTDLAERRDIPVLTEDLEVVGSPGVFLAGEITARSLIKFAIEQGTAVAAEVGHRIAAATRAREDLLDLCIVGAGPAGLACALEAKRLGLRFVVLDQASGPGGTVAKYPRRKLVLTAPVDLPLFGRLSQSTYEKEELISIWERIARDAELPLRYGEVFEGLEPGEDGVHLVRTAGGVHPARHVCLALGRRGLPRKLGVPGEELTKVSYDLLDANAYRNRRILVVGGGETAVETAVGLAEQPGNEVTLSYRKDTLFRIRGPSALRLETAMERRSLHVLLRSEVVSIESDRVDLEVMNGSGPSRTTLANDEVFVMAGGVPPFELLERSGVSFDPKLRPRVDPVGEQGNGVLRALAIGFLLALLALGWALFHSDYYTLPAQARPVHEKHFSLRPGQGLGLLLGIASTALIAFNLSYLLRRSRRWGVVFGSLRAWMTAHVATGILALLCAVLHSGMAPRDTVGGHALWALVVLLVTGAIGRYFYSYVPRAANGRELQLDEVRRHVASLSQTWDTSQRAFVERVQAEIEGVIERRQWRSSFFGRVLALAFGQQDLRRVLGRLEEDGLSAGVSGDRVRETLALARRAHRTALAAAHYEDLRAILETWRYLHRWVAALMILLLLLHIGYATFYGSALRPGGAP